MHQERERLHRKDRHDVDVEAVAYRDDGTKSAVRICNLSDGGCRLESNVEFRVGERLQVAMPRMGYLRVQVRWVEPGSAGAKFVIESDF